MKSKPDRRAHPDWQETRRRLAAIAERLEGQELQPPDEIRRILKARARELAKAPGVESDAETIEVVMFQLAYERYAVETRYVREVFRLEELTPLPCTPDFVLGIVNLRGEIVSVVDIKKFFGLPEKGITDLNRIVLLESGGMAFGILADAIDGVRELPVEAMRSSQSMPAGIQEDYIQGITASGLAVLDARAILDDGKIVVQEQVMARGPRG
ncbi:MAG TPA: chemotaxis protein CheW [Gammaproteobacteria bacterium]